MPTESVTQPGTFGSISGTTTIYPYKFRNYILCLETLFFLILIIITIVPNSIMIVSKFIVIAPDIVTTFSDPNIRIPFIIVAPIMVVFGLYIYLARAPIKYVLTKEGIFFSNHLYRIYSPWENIIEVETIKYYRYSIKGLKLDEGFQYGPVIKEGKQQGLPVFEYTKPVYAKRYSPKKAHQISSIFPWTDIFPLSGMSNKKGIKKSLLVAMHLYAPYVLTEQINALEAR